MATIEQLKEAIDAGKTALFLHPASRLGPKYVDTQTRICKREEGYVYQLSYPQFHEQPQPTLYKDWDELLARLGGVVVQSDVWQIEEKQQIIGTECR